MISSSFKIQASLTDESESVILRCKIRAFQKFAVCNLIANIAKTIKLVYMKLLLKYVPVVAHIPTTFETLLLVYGFV